MVKAVAVTPSTSIHKIVGVLEVESTDIDNAASVKECIA